MKRLSIAVLGLLLAAGCSSSSSTPSSTNNFTRFTATLLPSNETPPVTNTESSGRGDATIDFNITRDASGTITAAAVNFTVNMSNFPATTTTLTAAHIHPGVAGAAGPPLVNATINAGDVTFANGAATFTKVGITMSAANAQSILDSPASFYFNIHTSANPGGVARGQLVKQ